MLRGLAQLTFATAVRFGTGVFTFVFAAKQWTPELFGQFMYCFSLATMFVLFSEFGFTQQILKDVGANPECLVNRLNRFFAAKTWLTVLVLGGSLAFSLFSSSASPGQFGLSMLLVVACCIASFADLLLTTLRAVGRYGVEVRISLLTNSAALLAFVVVLALGGSPLALAATFVLVRLAQLGAVAKACAFRWFEPAQFIACAKPKRVLKTIRAGQTYAFDVVVTTALTNMDTILVAKLSGYAQAGIYQAAARWSQGVAIVFSVVASYFLPKLALMDSAGNRRGRIVGRFFIVSFAVSVVLVVGFCAAAIYYSMQPTKSVLFQSVSLLYGFATIVGVRILSGSLGVLMTACGQQKTRALLYCGALVVFVGTAYLLIPTMGGWGAINAYAVSYSLLVLGFAFSSPLPFRKSAVAVSVLLVLLSALALVLIFNNRV